MYYVSVLRITTRSPASITFHTIEIKNIDLPIVCVDCTPILAAMAGAAGRVWRIASRISLLSAGGVTGGLAYCATHDVYATGFGNYLRRLDGEAAHRFAVRAASLGLASPYFRRFAPADPEILRTQVWGHDFKNPIGLAAGFDKDAEAVRGLFAIGFGLVEVGTVTPHPQPGNARPRVFRLPEDRALINRYGFNSAGLAAARKRLARFDSGGKDALRVGILGVNVGKNKDTSADDAVVDYCAGVRALGDLAEYIVVNVSSPNTAGLRDLQRKDTLRELLVPVLAERDRLMYKAPLVVKIAPDLSTEERREVAELALELRLDGLIVSNTTVGREGLKSKFAAEKGGLSGAPLEKMATEMVAEMYSLTEGRVPIVGVGGVETGKDAYRKIRAGASLVQIYTALVYQGPWMVDRIKKELAALLEHDGFKSVKDAVGADHR